MARMFPEQFPGENDPQNPEFTVYQTLRALPDSYSVFYSRKFKGGKRSREECEIDFLVFDGGKTLLCVEVKGGLIEYRGDEDAWFQNGKLLSPSPDRQAAAGKAALLEFLAETATDINVGWLLCFPDCSLPDNFRPPAGLPRQVLVDQRKLVDLAAALETTRAYYISEFGRPGANTTRATEVVTKLNRGIGFITKLGVRVARDKKQLVEVTDEQMQVLDDLMVNPRMAVKGYAGSGKTLIAQEFAKRLEADGHSVLLLFFNRMIANSVRYGLQRDSRIECTTFHSLARHLINESDPGWWESNSTTSDDFWNVEVPLKLLDIPINSAGRYDAIIVDEGQDFKKTWYETLETLLLNPSKGRFVVFYDDLQDIFGHWNDLPWGTSNVARKVLSKNCRNTKSITGFLCKAHSCGMTAYERSPAGEKVIERTASSIKEEQRQLLSDIKELIAGGIFPGQIVLIINQPRQDSCLADLHQIGNHKLEAIGRTYHDRSNAIRYTNIRLFKGLEADVVYLLGLPAKQSANAGIQVYTQGSRAQTLLYVSRINQGGVL